MNRSVWSVAMCLLFQWNGTTQAIQNSFGFLPPSAEGHKNKVRTGHTEQTAADVIVDNYINLHTHTILWSFFHHILYYDVCISQNTVLWHVFDDML